MFFASFWIVAVVVIVLSTNAPVAQQYVTHCGTRIASVAVDLAIPPQQLDRDQSVVYDRHMPDSREGRLKTANIYTAVTRRSVPGSDPPTFDALNREMVPVPQLMDRESPKATAYNKVSITPWRNQVTKYDLPFFIYCYLS